MRNPWLMMRDLLFEEKKAIIKADIEGLLSCVQRKERLLKDPALKNTPIPSEIREEILFLLRHNRMLLEEALSFVHEAYQFLSQNMAPKFGYQKNGQAKNIQAPQILNGIA